MTGLPKNTGFRANHGAQDPGFSYWESKGWLDGLHAVVLGAGLVGTSAALRLREMHPDWRIAILDRSSVGGATTRNAGFACFGSPSELMEDWTLLGREATVRLVRMRWEGLRALRSRWGDSALGYRPCGAVEAFTDPELMARCLAMLPEINEALSDVFERAPFDVQSPGPGLRNLCGSIASPLEGDLDTSKLASALSEALHANTIRSLLGVEVRGLEQCGNGWEIHTSHGSFHAPNVVVATNAWASELLDVDVVPTANHVLVSHPLPGHQLTHTVHHDRGYVYAREVDGRLLVGGGRHWDCSCEEERVERLTEWARTHLVGAESWQTEHHWIGHLGIGRVREPVVKQIQPGLVAGVRLGGMGVAIGTAVGHALADLV